MRITRKLVTFPPTLSLIVTAAEVKQEDGIVLQAFGTVVLVSR